MSRFCAPRIIQVHGVKPMRPEASAIRFCVATKIIRIDQGYEKLIFSSVEINKTSLSYCSPKYRAFLSGDILIL